MSRQCRGVACIINVQETVGMAPRSGTNVDRDRLKLLFEKFHFRVRVFDDGDGLSAEVC